MSRYFYKLAVLNDPRFLLATGGLQGRDGDVRERSLQLRRRPIV